MKETFFYCFEDKNGNRTFHKTTTSRVRNELCRLLIDRAIKKNLTLYGPETDRNILAEDIFCKDNDC
ncbi:MAG: hypothetical protein EOM23_02945 [Candidatus Moranbacteria bacterium]|nr:hypothetical protein [Candidatus Moranbacteria bacterium]